MKLRYLSTLVSSILVVSTTAVSAAEIYNKDGNKLDLFGVLNGKHYLSNDHTKNGDRSFVHYGFRGETRISDQLIGFGMWEYETALRHSEDSGPEDNHTCFGYAGIKFGDFGSVDYGRNHGILYTIGAWTDIRPEFGGDTSVIDNFLSNRASSVTTYRNSNFFGLVNGLNFALQYQPKNDHNKDIYRRLKESNGDGYGIAVSYSISNEVSAAVAYANSNLTIDQKALSRNQNSSHHHAEACSFGLKYDANNLYLAALYSEARHMVPFGDFEGIQSTDHIYGFAEKAKNVELIAQYLFDMGLRPSIGYLQSKGCNIGDGYSGYIKKYIEMGSSYNFNSNMLTFIDYRINLLKQDDLTHATRTSTDNILALGMTYMF